MESIINATPAGHGASSWPAAIESGLVDAVPEVRPLIGTTRLGVVTALQAEAECLHQGGNDTAPLIYVSGGSPARAQAGAEQLLAEGAAGLVSFGLGIGLAPILRPGDVVVAESVVLPSGSTIPTDREWRTRLMHRLTDGELNVRAARIAGSDQPLLSASAKRRAFQMTFAAAMDTQSHAIAEVAMAAGLPLLVVRAIAEPAEAMRPGVAFAATNADGQTRSLAIVSHLAAHPWEIPAAWRFSRDGRTALEALRRVASIGLEPFAFGMG